MKINQKKTLMKMMNIKIITLIIIMKFKKNQYLVPNYLKISGSFLNKQIFFLEQSNIKIIKIKNNIIRIIKILKNKVQNNTKKKK